MGDGARTMVLQGEHDVDVQLVVLFTIQNAGDRASGARALESERTRDIIVSRALIRDAKNERGGIRKARSLARI